MASVTPLSPSVCRYDREGDETTVRDSGGEGNSALEQIHEQHVRAAEQAGQQRAGCWTLPGAGTAHSQPDGLFLTSGERRKTRFKMKQKQNFSFHDMLGH